MYWNVLKSKNLLARKIDSNCLSGKCLFLFYISFFFFFGFILLLGANISEVDRNNEPPVKFYHDNYTYKLFCILSQLRLCCWARPRCPEHPVSLH